MKNNLEIHFGALCDPIAVQIKKQGFKFDKKQVSVFQKKADAIILLRFDNILIDSAATKCQNKLFKKIITHVKKSNKK